MRRFLTATFILLALVGSSMTVAPVHALAQQPDPSLVGSPAPSSARTSSTTSTTANFPTGPKLDSSESSVMADIMNLIMKLFAWLLGVAAITLDNAVYYTVVTMGNLVNNLTAIGVTWRILRDLGNILLIFGFLLVGISIIVNYNIYGWKKELLPMLLIVAVAMNFSLFASEAVIDIGNLFATQFYTQINGGQPAQPTGYSTSNIQNEGISSKIMSQLGLQTIYGNALNDPTVFKPGSSVLLGFMGTLLFLIAAFVMFSLAFILIARFVILVVLLVAAPIGFAGFAIPPLKKIADQWWSTLFEQTITAPVLLLMLYVALAVITDAQFLTGFGAGNWGAGAWTGFVDGTGQGLTAFAGVLLSFFVAIGLLLCVIYLSKRLGAMGSDAAIKWGGRLSFGAAAYGLSGAGNAAGRLTRYGIQNTRLGQTALGRGLTRVARPLENARLDVRRFPGVQAGLKATGASAAAGPIKDSAAGRFRQGWKWYQDSGKAATKQYESETRVQTLQALIAAGKTSDVAKALNKLSDDELKSDAVQDLLTANPQLVKMLPTNKFGMLPEKTLKNGGIIQEASASQLESLRRSGNISDATAKEIGAQLSRSVAYFALYHQGKADKKRELSSFWGYAPPTL